MSSGDADTNDKEEISGPGQGRRGEEIASGHHEKGQHETGQTGAGRPAGTGDARRSTGINSEN